MNGWDILDAVGGIDPALIENAAQTEPPRRRHNPRTVRVIAAAAAGVAAAVAIGLAARHAGQIAAEPTSLYGEEGSAVIAPEGAGNNAGDLSGAGESASVTKAVTAPAAGETAADTGAAATSAAGESVAETGAVTTTGHEGAASGTEPTGAIAPTDIASSQAEITSAAPPVPENATEPPDGDYAGGVTAPAAWSEQTPVTAGTAYTEDEIAALLARDKFAIAQTAAAETGCAVGDVRILTEGYCHASLGAENVVDLGYLCLPVCVGDRVVASVDLFRVDGEVHYSVSAGGPRWDAVNRALAYGEVAFSYAGYGELAVAADGTVFDITVDASQAVAGETNLYQRAATPYTVFSLTRLQTADYVTVAT